MRRAIRKRSVLMFVLLGVLLSTTAAGAGANTQPSAQPSAETSQTVEDSTNVDQLEPTVLPAPPFAYYASPELSKSAAPVKTIKLALTQKAVKTIPSDRITKYLSPANEYEVPNPFQSIKGNVPSSIPTQYKGQMLVRAIKGKDQILLVYGLNFSQNRYLVLMDKSLTRFLAAYDFINYSMSPKYIKADQDYIYQQLEWAAVDNGILYVSHSHSTYAKSSNGMNGYLTAIRLSDNQMLWRSAPLVSNTSNFMISGNVILSGYGFTAEKDYLYQIDKQTGKTLDKVLLKDGPDYLEKQNNNLLVYGYAHKTTFVIK